MKSCTRGGVQGRAQSLFCVWELWGREQWGEWVAHQAAPGAEVVVRKKGRWAIPKEDLLVGIREVRG
jgi:hypothetical protein